MMKVQSFRNFMVSQTRNVIFSIIIHRSHSRPCPACFTGITQVILRLEKFQEKLEKESTTRKSFRNFDDPRLVFRAEHPFKPGKFSRDEKFALLSILERKIGVVHPSANKTNSNVGVAVAVLLSFLDREPTSRPQGMEVRDNKQ